MRRNNIEKCRSLRINQTDAEKKLWMILRNRHLAGMKFRRQFPVGRYILDFYAPQYKLGVEADGGQHYDSNGREKDELRGEELSRAGVWILRFNNREILNNSDGVCEVICKAKERLEGNPPHLSPLPKGERR
jgi:very-short-patch-repair endonuclease